MKPATDASILAAALIVSLVWLSPSRALADELPKDTNQIESLTLEQAKKLAAEFPGVTVAERVESMTSCTPGCLPLNGLKSLDAATAQALAGFEGGGLYLNGLTRLDVATAKALAEFKGRKLELNRPTTLDIDIAKTLAALDKWDGDLSSIVAIESPDSVEIAATLATRKGPLRLPNLKKISPKTLAALIEKEDVMLPKEFQTRQKARQQGR
jgi:hypothetical protein